jgi:hypothetical protein
VLNHILLMHRSTIANFWPCKSSHFPIKILHVTICILLRYCYFCCIFQYFICLFIFALHVAVSITHAEISHIIIVTFYVIITTFVWYNCHLYMLLCLTKNIEFSSCLDKSMPFCFLSLSYSHAFTCIYNTHIYYIIKTQVGSVTCRLHVRSQGVEILSLIKKLEKKKDLDPLF